MRSAVSCATSDGSRRYRDTVIEVTPDGLILREIAADTTVERVKAATGATLIVPDKVGTFE